LYLEELVSEEVQVSANLNTRGKISKRDLFVAESKILCPTLTCVSDPSDCRVAFISRGQPQEVASVTSDASAVRWWHIVDTDSQQAVDNENRGARCRPAFSLPRRDLMMESGDKVVWISGSAVSGSVVEGPPTEEPRPDASNARSQQPAPEGNWCASCSCLCVKHPWLHTGVLHCPGHPSCAGA
jgi:hypothetical protein